MKSTETVFALATPPGRAALSLVRISGPEVARILAALTRRPAPPPRRAVLRSIFEPSTGEKIDDAVVTWFSAPHSFTGEDSAEISVHGARSVVAALSRALSTFVDVRAAEPGEFTKRAFLNGKLDLSQAEAIADLIDSETEYQRRQALRVLDGGLGRRAQKWREMLLSISAALESELDFSDEGDVGGADYATLTQDCAALVADLQSELDASKRASALREGFTVLIVGPPNAGKSTLFNCLIGRDAAIVTDIPGTTRDLIEARLDLGGLPVTLIDSAGLRASSDPVERLGIEKAHQAARSADLVLRLVSADTIQEDVAYLEGPHVLDVWSKADLGTTQAGQLAVSARDPVSVVALTEAIRAKALSGLGDGSEGQLIRERHISIVSGCVVALNDARNNIAARSLELAAEDCRRARMLLTDLSGATLTEDVLGAIFARFCIGK